MSEFDGLATYNEIWLAGIFQTSGTIGLTKIVRNDKEYVYPMLQFEGEENICNEIRHRAGKVGVVSPRNNGERWRWRCSTDEAIQLVKLMRKHLLFDRRDKAQEILDNCVKTENPE